MDAAFERAVARVFALEGGLTTDPADPGGVTKYGIAQRWYPEVDVRALTRADARALYHRDFWRAYRYDALPQAAGAKTFELAVNMGPGDAHRCLQRALRACGRPVRADGILGPRTRAAAVAVPEAALLAALRSEAAGWYRVRAARDPQARRFLRGWLHRAYA